MRTSTAIAICNAAEDLAAIRRPNIQLAIWCRALPLPLKNWIERLDVAELPRIRALVEPQDLRRVLQALLKPTGLPPGEMRDLLISDVGGLVSEFSKVTRTDLVDVRLECISHDACWKFHRDRVEARLLTTYGGPATEWVQPVQAEQALREQKRYKGPVEQLRSGDVAIFKGTCGGPGGGIVHRSPPMASTRRTRLVLCLNKRLVSSPKRWSGDLQPSLSRT